MRKPIVPVLELALMLSSALMMNAGTPAEDMLDLDRPMVIGHRGYPTIAPENTIPGFRLAKLAGADLVELDYHLSLDGEAIVIHDGKLDRTTDAVSAWGAEDVSVAEKSIKELKTLDAGSWYGDEFAGIRLPTLEEALELIQADGGVTLIERKEGSATHIVEFLREKELVNQVVLQSFDWDFLSQVNEIAGDQVLWALGPQKYWDNRKLSEEERSLSPMWIDRVQETGSKVVVWNGSVDRASVDYAHGKGFKVVVYTVNEVQKAQELIRLGVDGIISNNVSLIWKALALMEEER